MKKTHLLLDLDGTLTDSKPGISACIFYALQKIGFETHENIDFSWCVGPPLKESFLKILGTTHASRADEALAFYRERFVTTGMFENSVYAGIPEMLQDLREAGHQLYVATSKPRVFAEKILEHFQIAQYFQKIYGSELDGSLSKKAQLIEALIARENLTKPSTLMIGDRDFDILGAKANGIESLGVLWGYGSKQELYLAGADQLCSAPDEVLALVE